MSDAHPLLTNDQDPPGAWEVGWIGGNYVSYSRPIGNETLEYVVAQLKGNRDDGAESRPVEVWVADIPNDHRPMNYADAGETIGTGTGLSEGAAIALRYMEAADD